MSVKHSPAAFDRSAALQLGDEVQSYGTVVRRPIALDGRTRAASVDALNQLLVDSMVLRDLYKKHHWQTTGATFHQLHLLFDSHYNEQVAVIDLIAERIQALGGVSLAMAHDVAEKTRIARAPRGREPVPAQLSRLIEAHEQILTFARGAAVEATGRGDDGSNDLLVSDVIRTHEKEVWFLSELLVATPAVQLTPGSD